MLNIGFKGTTTQNYDFNVTTMKLVDGIMCAVMTFNVLHHLGPFKKILRQVKKINTAVFYVVA